MLIVAVHATVESDAVEKVRAVLSTMEQRSRDEAGCLDYAFSLEINDSSRLRVFERWESMEALESHFATPHMAAFIEAIATLSPKDLDIKCYEVAGERPMPGSA